MAPPPEPLAADPVTIRFMLTSRWAPGTDDGGRKPKKNKWLPGTGSIGRPSRTPSTASPGCHRVDPVTYGLMVTTGAARWGT